jgi:N-acetylglucosaminyldiphosphoundecaprenol N-acetyl-beta-D-mannosaminyltransferase
MKKIRFGTIHADCLTFDEAIDRIVALVHARAGGFVVTPNVDHVVLAETNQGLRDAYHDAALSLADGMPLLWMAKAMGHPLPEKISGSDLMMPLLRRAARDSLGVYLLGGMPGVADTAARKLVEEIPHLAVVGTDAPELGFEKDDITLWQTIDKVREAKPTS